MKKQTVHVVPHGSDWAIKKSGNDRASSVKPTQADAIDTGRKMAIDMGTELFIHRRDGTIRDRDSYGNDPCPPKDKKH